MEVLVKGNSMDTNRYKPPSLTANQFTVPKLMCPSSDSNCLNWVETSSRIDSDILFEVPWCGCKKCVGGIGGEVDVGNERFVCGGDTGTSEK